MRLSHRSLGIWCSSATLLVLACATPVSAQVRETESGQSTSALPTVQPLPSEQGAPFADQPQTAFSAPVERQAVGPVLMNPNYMLGPGDQIAIEVYGYEEYTGQKVVLADGTIQLPLIGSVMANGRTTDQLARDLEARLRAYLVNPVVTVTMTALRPIVVNVAGEVQRPGPVRLRSLTTLENAGGGIDAENPTLTTALVQAGGVTRRADIRQVVLRRFDPRGTSQPITINLWDAIGSDNAPPDLIVQDGDTIYVPRLPENETIDRRLIARSSLSPATVRVRVVGQVVQPGEVLVPPDSSLSSAIAIAGGPTEDARLSRVAFVRMSDQGQIESQVLDLRNLVDNYQVQDGDVLIIPKKGSSSFLDFLGRVLNPFDSILNILSDIDDLGGSN